VQEHCPPENYYSPLATRCRFISRYLPFTIRYSPLATRRRFGLGKNPTSKKISPTKVGAHWVRHKLLAKASSMDKLFSLMKSKTCSTKPLMGF
jgi:hypothetical protein